MQGKNLICGFKKKELKLEVVWESSAEKRFAIKFFARSHTKNNDTLDFIIIEAYSMYEHQIYRM